MEEPKVLDFDSKSVALEEIDRSELVTSVKDSVRATVSTEVSLNGTTRTSWETDKSAEILSNSGAPKLDVVVAIPRHVARSLAGAVKKSSKN